MNKQRSKMWYFLELEKNLILSILRKHYDITIGDHRQPLLINRPKRTKSSPLAGAASKPENTEVICLIPELCYLTGMSEDIRNDIGIKKVDTILCFLPPVNYIRLCIFLSIMIFSGLANSHASHAQPKSRPTQNIDRQHKKNATSITVYYQLGPRTRLWPLPDVWQNGAQRKDLFRPKRIWNRCQMWLVKTLWQRKSATKCWIQWLGMCLSGQPRTSRWEICHDGYRISKENRYFFVHADHCSFG